MADTEGGEIVRFELGLEYHSVERTKDGYFVGFNYATDPRIRNLECDGGVPYYDIRMSAASRRARLTQLMEDYRGEIDTEAAKTILSDHYDVYLGEEDNLGSRSVCAHYELDPFEYWQGRPPYFSRGAVDGKVMDSEMAEEMSFVFRWGSSCGRPFDAGEFFEKHPQYDFLEGWIKDRPAQPWTRFTAGNGSP